MAQDQKLWLKLTPEEVASYHEQQFKIPYRSTVFFSEFLKSQKLLSPKDSKNILDLACGEGAVISFLSHKFPKAKFTGIDLNKNLVKKGNKFFKELGVNNCNLEVGDLYALSKNYIGAFDGVISLQTLSWLPSYQTPLKQMIKLKPKWIAISSLFYDGFVEAEIKVRDYTNSKGKKAQEVFYNVYSLKLIENFFKKNGYGKFKYIPFVIDQDIAKNKEGRMGTYTVKTDLGSRLQISGPLLMNWYFISAQKV